MDLNGRNAVVTGGAGALGAAVVGRLLDAGAICHVPALDDGEAERFPHAGHDRVRLNVAGDLADWARSSGSIRASTVCGPRSPRRRVRHGRHRRRPARDVRTPGLDERRDLLFVLPRGGRLLAPRGHRRAHRQRLGAARGRAAERRRDGGLRAAKAAVAALTQALAEEVASEGIWVNAVAPSILDTPANRAAMPEADHAAWPKTGEVAETIVFLASARQRGHPRRRGPGLWRGLGRICFCGTAVAAARPMSLPALR